MNSRVHPKYKTKYSVSNWAEYDRALVQRGDITLWISPDAADSWTSGPSGKRGGQRRFSDQAIETALVLRLVFNLPLRQAEGFLRAVLSLMALDLEAPDHTTISRRSQQVDVGLRLAATKGRLHLIVDSTGLSIIAEVLTDGNADDARTALGLIDDVDGEIASFTADAAYDTIAIYDAAFARDAKVIVPSRMSATRSMRSGARDRTVRRIKKVERRQWKKESEYHRQGRVESTFFRYKSIIGGRLWARHPESQEAEVLIACNILNRMFELGRPKSFAVK
jgi:Transposase DDE domain